MRGAHIQRGGSEVTTEVKILRDGLKKIRQDARISNIKNLDQSITVILLKADKAIKTVDAVKDGLNIGLLGEDLETVKVYRAMQPFIKVKKIFGITVRYRFDAERVNGCINWMLDKLEQSGAREQLTKYKRDRKDGPNEKEKTFLKKLIYEHLNTDHIPTMDKEYKSNCVECWKLKKLDQAWEMK